MMRAGFDDRLRFRMLLQWRPPNPALLVNCVDTSAAHRDGDTPTDLVRSTVWVAEPLKSPRVQARPLPPNSKSVFVDVILGNFENFSRSFRRLRRGKADSCNGTDLACGGVLASAMPQISKPLQVYVVDDSPIIRRLLASTVEAAGAQMVGQSDTAAAAIADLSGMNPDLIVIDIGLRSGSGFDVLEALQTKHLAPTAIKVVFTNHAQADFETLSLTLGAVRFFDKSSDTSQVLALINALARESMGCTSSLSASLQSMKRDAR